MDTETEQNFTGLKIFASEGEPRQGNFIQHQGEIRLTRDHFIAEFNQIHVLIVLLADMILALT